MKRGLGLSVWALTFAIVAPLACGVTSGNSGSNTNWLSICANDDDCSDGYSCLCGVCTDPCQLDDDDCAQSGAQCTALAELGCAPSDDHDNVCLPSCSGDADCDEFGNGLACETGVCVAATALDAPTDPTDGLDLPDLEPLSGTARLALGGGDSPCVARAGRVWCWGENQAGQAGQLPSEEYLPITELKELEGVTDLVAAAQHKCALTDEGRVFCWGINDMGQVGPSSAPEMTCSVTVLDVGPEDVPCQPTPTQIPDIPRAMTLGVNDVISCATLADSTEFTCWGDASFVFSAVGEQSDAIDDLAPSDTLCGSSKSTGKSWCSTDIPEFGHGALRALAYSAEYDGGPTYGCALDVNGRVDCWGRDDSGQRGLASFGSPVPNADDPPTLSGGALQVSVGQNHACALLEDGTVTCWGRNDFGQTGAPSGVSPRCNGIPCQPSPTPVAGLPRAAYVASRGNTTCVLSRDAELYCWGGTDSGSPWRIPGPWEGGETSCDGIDHAIADELLEVRRADYTYTSCETDRDCVELDLGVSCYQGCQSAPMHKNQAEVMTAELERIESTYCPSAEQLDCNFARPECPPRAGELACVEGACVRFDSDATECDNACACKVLENIASDPPVVEQQCEGHHLMLHRFVNCGGCGSSRSYFAIANYGQTTFAGDVSIELESETEADLPEPLTVTLSLEPGAHSQPLYFEFSQGSGSALARVVVADNCDYMAEWSEVHFEIPTIEECSE